MSSSTIAFELNNKIHMPKCFFCLLYGKILSRLQRLLVVFDVDLTQAKWKKELKKPMKNPLRFLHTLLQVFCYRLLKVILFSIKIAE